MSNTATIKGNDKVFEDVDPQIRIRTKKMLMWLIIFAIVMLFAGLTSAYIVSSFGDYWVHIEAPSALWWSNALIILSSIPMYLSLSAMKKGNKKQSMIMLAITLCLGLAFTVSQYQGWEDLKAKGMGVSFFETDLGIKSQWNNIDRITGEYGVDYYVLQDGRELIYNKGEFYAPDDVLMANPVTSQVKEMSNSSSALVWVLIAIHILHLVFGLAYLIVNLIRSSTGVINQGDTIRLYVNGMYWHFLGILWVYLFAFLFVIH
ncbi:MAG: cytochrome c oxidase subunit 3 [Flavobacteriales bacterium]|nr:cytochrome c oxidase subunit 3 [Flavobacteriales bacterium]MDG1780702.1 cytochrome c oxidase subunit 3 [Flavobacteriales bacterium]MDG2244911.1 cytochrome c oxidase subunit 3 [Flavobacteriales bacterium]